MEETPGGFRYITEVICMRKKWLLRLLLLALMVLAAVGLDQRMIVRRYTIETDKLTAPIRLAVVADYHGCDYGDGLIPDIASLQPDAVLLVGDIFDDEIPWARSEALVYGLAERYPCYYVTGNHEYWSGQADEICRIITDAGATVLDAAHAELTVNGQTINICGIPDPESSLDISTALSRTAEGITNNAYTILLAHRPESIDTYAATGDFDLVVSGHAHGGQVRIPFLVNGLFSPDQGFFPKFAGGMYEIDDTVLIVSRGLARESTRIPRIFNRPELVLVSSVPLHLACD